MEFVLPKDWKISVYLKIKLKLNLPYLWKIGVPT